MSDSITRRQLEELMMSLSFNIHTNEDIQFLNQLYNNNQADMYIFRLTNTKKYFESIIIPYCKEHWNEIKDNISNPIIKDKFTNNFCDNIAINSIKIYLNKDQFPRENMLLVNDKKYNKYNKNKKKCCKCEVI